MKLYISINNKEFEVKNIQELKEELNLLNAYIELNEDTGEKFYFTFPPDLFKKRKTKTVSKGVCIRTIFSKLKSFFKLKAY